ncbi:metal-sensing transcriptional repressor [Ottowia sp. VDI28]|uniref:metal-sensing transcriptional repressor n=1 Tax=Ottowia sp. VDI28 TaxID=3133968 RepID=UPI003C2F24FB
MAELNMPHRSAISTNQHKAGARIKVRTERVRHMDWRTIVQRAMEAVSYPPLGDIFKSKLRRKDQTHPEIIKRLRRAGGPFNGIVEMIEQGRSCLDIDQQLQAVEKAIQQTNKTLIQDRIDDCFEGVNGPFA